MVLNRIIFFIKKNKVVLFILILGCTPLIWFKNNLILIHQDVLYHLYEYGFNDLANNFYSWIEQTYAGNLNISRLAEIFPFLFFWTFFRELSFSFLTVEKIWYIILFTLPGLSMYYCVSVFNNKHNNANPLVASIFYMFNPFILIYVTTLLWPTILIYGLTPLIFGLFLRGLETQNYNKYAFLISISSIFFASSGNNLATYSLAWFPIFFYAIYRILLYKKVREFLFLVKTILTVFFLNFFWIIGYIFFFLVIINTRSSGLFQDLQSSYIADSSLSNLFRLIGAAGWMQTFLGTEHYPYSPSYNSVLLIFTTFVPIVIIFFVAFKKLNKKYNIFFFIIIIIGLFLAKGENGPFGNIFLFIYKKIPIFSIYRGVFYRFMPMVVFAYSILFGIGANLVSEGISKIKQSNIFINNIKKVFIVFIISVIFLNSWPLLTGDVIPNRKGVYTGTEVKIPTYWFEMSNYIGSLNRNSRIFILPENTHPIYTVYNWKEYPYHGAEITPYIIRGQMIYNDSEAYITPKYTKKFLDYIYLKIKSNDSENLGKLLSFLGVQYILQRNDLDWTFYGLNEGTNPKQINEVLSNNEDIYIKKTLGELDLYELSSDIVLPRFYIAKNVIISDKGVEKFTDIINSNDYSQRSVIYINNYIENSSSEKLKELGKNALSINKYGKNEIPTIIFEKINPTKYRIIVKNAKDPYVLVFTENYSEYWKLYSNINNSKLNKNGYNEEVISYFNGEVKECTSRTTFLEIDTFETWFKKSILEDRHLVANGYANSWYIESSNVGGKENYELIIEFWPQKFYFLAIIISGVTLISIIGYLLYSRKKLIKIKGKKSKK